MVYMKKYFLFLNIVLIFFCSSALAKTASIKNIRIWSAPDSTRIVFDVTKSVDYKLSALKSPHRLVIDIKGIKLGKLLAQPEAHDKFLQKIRAAVVDKENLRVVFDLKKEFSYKSFQLKPNNIYGYRVVFDLYDHKDSKQTPVKVAEKNKEFSKLRDVVIAIDAGHGGEDPGAIGSSGIYEKNIVLDISKRLAKLLNNKFGMRAVLVRTGDYFINLRKRIEIARKHEADIFISIHADAFPDPKVKGSSVYILSRRGASSEAAKWLAKAENASDLIGGVSLDNKDDILASVLLDLSQTATLEASIELADILLKRLSKIGKVHKRTVQSAGFVVLKSPDIPSVLVETAFISNPNEEKKLRSKRYKNQIAKEIFNGINNYFDNHAPVGSFLASRKHRVKKGETLSIIANKYNVTVKKLKQQNGLKKDLIKIGKTLIIPK